MPLSSIRFHLPSSPRSTPPLPTSDASSTLPPQGDHKITLDEFTAAVPLIERWGSTDGRPPFKVGGECSHRTSTLRSAASALALLESHHFSGRGLQSAEEETRMRLPPPADAAAEFRRIDADASGAIRFDEFARWALEKRLDLEDDDEVRVGCWRVRVHVGCSSAMLVCVSVHLAVHVHAPSL